MSLSLIFPHRFSPEGDFKMGNAHPCVHSFVHLYHHPMQFLRYGLLEFRHFLNEQIWSGHVACLFTISIYPKMTDRELFYCLENIFCFSMITHISVATWLDQPPILGSHIVRDRSVSSINHLRWTHFENFLSYCTHASTDFFFVYHRVHSALDWLFSNVVQWIGTIGLGTCKTGFGKQAKIGNCRCLFL